MIELSVPNISNSEMKYVRECLRSNWVSSAGPLVEKFEKAVCKYVKAKYAVACVNGTSGLFIALKLCGVSSGDEVIVPALTFIAPVNAARYLGAEPVFMDCDDFMNLDAGKLEEFFREKCVVTDKGLRNKKSGRIIKAVMPVHIFGNPCNILQIMRIAKRYNLKVVEDATESLGSYYAQGLLRGRFTGTIGDAGVYSFNGNKIITSGGGGMIITNNKNLADRARYLVNQAKDDAIRSVHNEVGYNFRLTNLQAALGLAQLGRINSFIQNKKRNYELYKRELKNVEGVEVIGIPQGTRPNYWLYSLLIDKKAYGLDKEGLMRELAKCGIQTRPVWRLNHLQKPYLKNQAYKIEKALWFWKKILNIPSSSNLDESQVRRVAGQIRRLKR